MARWLTALAYTFATGLLDLGLTQRGLSLGLIAEANPFMAWLLAWGSTPAWLVKTAVLVAALGWLTWCRPHTPRLAAVGLALAATAHTLVLLLHARWMLADLSQVLPL